MRASRKSSRKSSRRRTRRTRLHDDFQDARCGLRRPAGSTPVAKRPLYARQQRANPGAADAHQGAGLQILLIDLHNLQSAPKSSKDSPNATTFKMLAANSADRRRRLYRRLYRRDYTGDPLGPRGPSSCVTEKSVRRSPPTRYSWPILNGCHRAFAPRVTSRAASVARPR